MDRKNIRAFINGPRIIPSSKRIAATGRYYPPWQAKNWELTLPSDTQYATGHDVWVTAVREDVFARRKT